MTVYYLVGASPIVVSSVKILKELVAVSIVIALVSDYVGLMLKPVDISQYEGVQVNRPHV